MSLIGIDVGSSSVKAVAYSVEGVPLAEGKAETTSIHEFEGQWEQDPEHVWDCACSAIRQLMQSDKVKKDPPVAIAVSASGREKISGMFDDVNHEGIMTVLRRPK